MSPLHVMRRPRLTLRLTAGAAGFSLAPPRVGALRLALRHARWPTPSDRPKVEAAGYLVLERPPAGAASIHGRRSTDVAENLQLRHLSSS